MTVDRRGISRVVLVTWPDFDSEHELIGGALRSSGFGVRLAPKVGARTPAEVKRLGDGVAGAIVSTDPFDADVLSSLPDLKVIARVGVGFDSIDLHAATDNGVVVTITPGANEAVVAEHTLALMLASLRRLTEHDRGVRNHKWNRTGPTMPWSLRGRTVGLVGFGQIGRLVARRLKEFEVRLLVSDPAPEDGIDLEVERVSLADLLRRSDVVSIHCPLLPTTRGLIGAPELALMPPHAILINTARGGIVDEAALVDALEQGRLRGAALDVFEIEPPTSPRLLALQNLLISPHIGALSEESVSEMTQRATTSVIDVLSGRRPVDVANPEVLRKLELVTDETTTPGAI